MRTSTPAAIRSVHKALRLLRAFDSRTLDLGLTELSASLGFPKSVTHKLARTLADAGFLEQDQKTRRYRIGPSVLAVAGAYMGSNPLIREGTVVLHQLSRKTGHTAVLGVLDKSDALYVAAVEGTHVVKASARIGDRRPLHATATGKVLLAGLRDAEVDRLLGSHPLPSLTKATITDPSALKRQLQAVRRTGVAYNFRERSEESSAVAAPVYDYTHQVIAAISLALPATLPARPVSGELTDVVIAHARELSRRLGAQQALVEASRMNGRAQARGLGTGSRRGTRVIHRRAG